MRPGSMAEPSRGCIPGTAQVPGNFAGAAGHQKISVAFKPLYGGGGGGGCPACLTGKSSVLTKEEWGRNAHATEDERGRDD